MVQFDVNTYMNKLITLALVLMLSGCATVQSWIPSFWDDNQSARVIDVRVKVLAINCTQPQDYQVLPIQQDLVWFIEYSRAKGVLQQDVIRLVEPMKTTVDAWVARGTGSVAYCELKKKILLQNSERAAKAVLGRY